jgi:hypothetical protein
MTQVQINGSDANTLYLLHLDLPPDAVERFTQMAGTGEWPLKYALGATRLSDSFVDVVTIKELGPMRLSQYMAQAYDVPARGLGADLARIDTLQGHVLILPPQAFDATSQTLAIAPPLKLIGQYGEAKPKGRGPAVTAKSAKGQGGGGQPTELGQGGSSLLKIIVGIVALVLAGTLWVALT